MESSLWQEIWELTGKADTGAGSESGSRCDIMAADGQFHGNVCKYQEAAAVTTGAGLSYCVDNTFVLMGIASYIVCETRDDDRMEALILYGVQLL